MKGWYGVCAARDLKARPRRFVIDGVPVVVFRAAGGLRALSDVCPHRFAPLSMGEVTGGRIQCPYHGWTFDGEGRCVAMPGLLEAPPRAKVAVFPVAEHDSIVFVALKPQTGAPYSRILAGPEIATAFAYNTVEARLADVAENILDATHTHFIHRGLLRGLSARRYRVRVTVSGGDDFIEARYEGEPQQEGLVSRLLEGGRGVSVGRFRAPGIAEIEFWGRRQLSLVTTFHLRQETPDRVAGLGVLSGPKQWGLGYVKAALFAPLFGLGVEQDRIILKAAARNRDLIGDAKPMIGPLDLLRSGIDAILRGQRPEAADRPVTMEMEL